MTSEPTTHHRPVPRRLRGGLMAATILAGAAGLLVACGGSTPAAAPGTATTTAAATNGPTVTGDPAPATGLVLPVDANPIANSTTTQGFTIDSVLVENNEAGGKAVDDHLELAVTNTTSADLSGFEVYYTITDPTDGLAESYYAQLPGGFTIAPGATRTIHFDNTGATDHVPVNAYSLYYTDANALDITVEVGATNAAPQTATAHKDAGGAEQAD